MIYHLPLGYYLSVKNFYSSVDDTMYLLIDMFDENGNIIEHCTDPKINTGLIDSKYNLPLSPSFPELLDIIEKKLQTELEILRTQENDYLTVDFGRNIARACRGQEAKTAQEACLQDRDSEDECHSCLQQADPLNILIQEHELAYPD